MTEEQKVNSLISKRELIFSRMQRILDHISSCNKTSLSSATVRYNKIESLSQEFRDVQNAILEFNSTISAKNQIEVENVEVAFEDLIYAAETVYSKLKTATGVLECEQNVSLNQSIETNLPKIQIPVFKGDIGSWRTFHELYQSCIHLSNIPAICKFQHLKSLLQGEALKLIEHFPLIDSNYLLAYQTLVNRYQSDRLLACHYLSKLFNYKPVSLTCRENLQAFLAAHQDSVDSFQALTIPDKTDFLLFYVAYNHLDRQSQASFDMKHDPQDIPSFQDLMDHVASILKYAELHSVQSSSLADRVQVKVKSSRSHALISKITESSESNPCHLCKGAHFLYQCPDFIGKSLQEKLDFVKSRNLCFNCLQSHFKNKCRSIYKCKMCKRNHHTLLHDENRIEEVSSKNVKNTMSSQVSARSKTLLSTISLNVMDSSHHLQPVRAVLDKCSESSLISLSCANRLGLKIRKQSDNVLGIGGISTSSVGSVMFLARSRTDPNFKIPVEALVLSELHQVLPSTKIVGSFAEKFKHLPLADPHFYVPSKIDLILGVDIFCEVMKKSAHTFKFGKPSVMNTPFGWIVLGKLDHSINSGNYTTLLIQTKLDEAIKQFWEVEEISCSKPGNPYDEYCEQLFCKTTTRNSEGRYVVALPFKPDAPLLATNRERGIRNFINLEKRLLNQPNLFSEYTKFMIDYLKQNHMQKAQVQSPYIIPQQIVFKESSTSTKLRTVFNASSPDSSGLSLNDRLFPGPKLQSELGEILLNFRFHRYVLCADLKQMYRQILLREEDQALQHIFWRPSPNEKIQEYQLCTVTYGMVPSAFLAQRVLQRLVEDEGKDFPKAAYTIIKQRYIDDFLAGANTVEQALQLYTELTELLSRGGFQLRKWSSNSPQIIAHIPRDHRETPLRFNDNSQAIKLLGLYWDPECDCFYFQIQPFTGNPTKRLVLSYIARTFDPMGFMSPVIFWVKYFIQKLWIDQKDWDGTLENPLLKEWQEFSRQLPSLSALKIPRHVPNGSCGQDLVGFSDASEHGCAACVYLRLSDHNGSKCYLIKSKTKVAPLKKLSIPRLELQAALLLSQLVHQITEHISLKIDNIYLFTDSEIVLAWLRLEPYKLDTFVANRVKKIQDLFPFKHWHHVNSQDNPADPPSRGLLPEQFLLLKNWLNGPSFLEFWSPESQKREIKESILIDLPELKKTVASFIVQSSEPNDFIYWFERFSSLSKLKRVLTYIIRFGNNTKNKIKKVDFPSKDEQDYAFLKAIKIQQEYDFADDLKRISETLPTKRVPHHLRPFLQDGLLRVGGRLPKASVNFEAKHPLILSKKSHLAKLIVEHYHQITGHSGCTFVQALVQREYWILGVRSLIRQVIHNCVKCARFRAKPFQPLMADLPPSRVNPSRPFSICATDFAGPFSIKESRRKNCPKSKAYLCVFICFATKAVHLEAVSSLTTEAFLAALDRFVSRRGCPGEIYSDNATNFVGASRQLHEITNFLNKRSDILYPEFAKRNIKWSFQPPQAPNFNGLVEAAVKSAKTILTKLTKDTPLYFEELTTLFCRIEAIMNSRPLCALPTDPTETVDYLSPGHFLIGAPLLSSPELPVAESLTLRCRWQRLRQTTQAFWRRWSLEYLQTLNSRFKWTKNVKNLEVGQIVLVAGPNPPMRWPLGLITATHPGPDGVVRVANVRVGGSVFARPVNKLVPLPVSQ